MEFNVIKTNNDYIFAQTLNISNKQDKGYFVEQQKEKKVPGKLKKHSMKGISDIFILSSSALLIGLPLLSSFRKNKKQAVIKQVENLKSAASSIQEEFQEIGQNTRTAPFIQKFGCFWDKMAKNHKELTNNVIYALGVIVVEPLVILFSPFGNKKTSKKDKVNAIARLPITMLSTLSFQYSLDKFIGDLVPKLSMEGLLGEKFKSMSPTFDDLPKVYQTKLNALKEATIFTLGLASLPLGICLTNTLFGKYMKYANNKQRTNKVQENNKSQISFKGSPAVKLVSEISEKSNELAILAQKDFEPTKGPTGRFYQWISKPIKRVLDSENFAQKIEKLGEQGIKSVAFQKLLMWGVVLKDTVRAIGNISLTYSNRDIPNEERVYLTWYHAGIGIPNLIVSIVAGFGAIKYQDKILENVLKKFKLNQSAHIRTKNGLKFFIPFAVATIIGKRIIAPAISIPIASSMKKKILNKQNNQNIASQNKP